MKIYLAIGSFAIIVIIGGYFWYVSSGKTPAPAQSSSGTFPNASSTSSQGNSFNISGGAQSQSNSHTPTMTVAARGTGSPIAVSDFIHNGATWPDPSNAGNFYLTSTSTTEYAISYDTSDQFFTIALEEEPIGKARLDAEQFLMKTLGLTESQMCGLQYYLGTDEYTNSFYAGKNLGFSFCSGATALPQ